jgi:very-short-patch-repair endonuclease
MMTFLYNDQVFKARRQELRGRQTKAEEVLWQRIRAGKVNGLKFYRQYSVGPYILDFYCPKIRVGIELDGESHDTTDAKIYDHERTTYLKGNKIKVIRFRNEEVIDNVERVIRTINSPLRTHLPLPLR